MDYYCSEIKKKKKTEKKTGAVPVLLWYERDKIH